MAFAVVSGVASSAVVLWGAVVMIVGVANGTWTWSFDPFGWLAAIFLVALPIQLWRHRDKYL